VREGELDLARRVDRRVEDLVVEQLRGRLVEVDGRAALLDDLVARLAPLGAAIAKAGLGSRRW